ncbi:NUDIX hydrolase [Leptotrichia sp. OH3620_COT-345]|uniref:NUDIX hydrolase n=1 Tax=Leptotrichia sp. OH3620_COT-345 TaxID=2491048 RepID=UPI000F647365|nr:NUDIX hydrolase [Leptotrichia sp. OH3620_COT-345]RRD39040.1 NUDIX hydrolase [Leptotrichia sp. OH3620_COT-345]
MFNLNSRTKLLENKWYRVFLDKITNNCTKIDYDFYTIDFLNDSVGTVVENKKGEILFVNSYRYITGSLSLEIPAGSLEKEENIKKGGIRECFEETGYKASFSDDIFTFYPSNGVSTQTFHVIFGKVDSEIEQNVFDKTETAEVVWLKKNEIIEKILNNIIIDSLTIVSLFIYFLKKGEIGFL